MLGRPTTKTLTPTPCLPHLHLALRPADPPRTSRVTRKPQSLPHLARSERVTVPRRFCRMPSRRTATQAMLGQMPTPTLMPNSWMVWLRLALCRTLDRLCPTTRPCLRRRVVAPGIPRRATRPARSRTPTRAPRTPTLIRSPGSRSLIIRPPRTPTPTRTLRSHTLIQQQRSHTLIQQLRSHTPTRTPVLRMAAPTDATWARSLGIRLSLCPVAWRRPHAGTTR